MTVSAPNRPAGGGKETRRAGRRRRGRHPAALRTPQTAPKELHLEARNAACDCAPAGTPDYQNCRARRNSARSRSQPCACGLVRRASWISASCGL